MTLYKYIKECLTKGSKINIITNAIMLLIFVALSAFVAYICIGGIYKTVSRYKNAEYTKAVVIDGFRSMRHRKYYSYKFYIGKNEYGGIGIYDPQSEIISVGDTIMVFYDSTDPGNNSPLREYYRP